MKKMLNDDGWRLTDDIWHQVAPLLPQRKTHPLGCHNPRVADRAAMDAILLVLRSGCQWNALDTTGLCTCSSAYRRFREWREAGVFAAFMHLSLASYGELRQIDWSRLTA
jgi:transposase